MDKLIVEYSNYFDVEKKDEYTAIIVTDDGQKVINAIVPEKMTHVVTYTCENCNQLTTSYLELIKDQREKRIVKTAEERGTALIAFVTYECECDKCHYTNHVVYDVQDVASSTSRSSKIVGSKPGDVK